VDFRIQKMAHEQALGGCPDSDLFTRNVMRVRIKGHTEVGTHNIDHGLPLLGIILREAFKGV
jgi:hypothetical protein